MVALDDDFAIFGRTADATLLLQEFAEREQVVGRTDETANECYGLAAPSGTLHAQSQFLLLFGQGLVFLRRCFLIREVGVGGKDHALTFAACRRCLSSLQIGWLRFYRCKYRPTNNY